MKIPLRISPRAPLLIVSCLVSLLVTGQTTGTVVDAGNNQPIVGARIYTNNNKMVTTNSKGKYTISSPFTSITLTKEGYMRRTLTKSELKGTIQLLPLSVTLNEVVVTAKRPRVALPVKEIIERELRGEHKPSGHDFLSIFRKNRVSAKERKKRHDAIVNY